MESTVVVTKHAKERYAERIMDIKDKIEINRYVVENESKIINDISKMINYGTLVYTGKNPRKDRFGATSQIRIFTCKAWILIVNADKNEVITLFKIDLGLDEDFNNQYVEKIMQKFNDKQLQLDKVSKEVTESNNELKENMFENTKKINTYKQYIKQLEEANNGCKAIMDANLIKIKEAEEELADVLERIVTKK